MTASLVCSLAVWLAASSSTQNAVAEGETRTLHLFHTHTQETIDATFRLNGRYDPEVLRQLNHFLRDWRNDDEISMDPRLFDAIWEAYRTAGATDRIQIYSAYRSPETNAMLRRRSKAVAEHSQHMLGKAMDTTMPGFPMHRIREAAMKLEHGGVGWYPSANFVHIDVGGVRSWPRMSYEQLSDLFPDGKTVHIASNGKTLPGYEEARAELAQRGQTELPPSQEDSGGFFAWLFGGGGSGSGTAREDEEDRRVAVAAAAPQPQPQPVAQAQPEPVAQPQPQPTQQAALAYAPAAQQAQPAEGQAQFVGPAGLVAQPGQQAQPQGPQVASLEPTEIVPAVVMPLPPRRPADLVAVEPDVPLPPERPGALDTIELASLRGSDADAWPRRSDAIGRLITATASGVPAMRRSGLPALITQGTVSRHRTQGVALAFAPSDADATESALDLQSQGPKTSRGPKALKPMALRAQRHRNASIVASTSQDGSALPVARPCLTGLRRAAQILSAKAAL